MIVDFIITVLLLLVLVPIILVMIAIAVFDEEPVDRDDTYDNDPR